MATDIWGAPTLAASLNRLNTASIAKPLSPAAPASPLSSALQQLQNTTQAGTPDWINSAVGPIRTTLNPLVSPWSQAVAAVDPATPNTIGVIKPNEYNKSVAAHEATHIFDESRNSYFTSRNMDTWKPQTFDLKNYDYGGSTGLVAHPLDIGAYNPEQRASIVGDFTAIQDANTNGSLATWLNPDEWDKRKDAYEHQIRNLINIPAKEAPSLLGKIPAMARLRDLISPPKINILTPPAPNVSSVGMGYNVPSKLVK